MSDRLTELQRQRAIIQGHLAWLDKEIAASAADPAQTSLPSPVSFQPSRTAPAATPAAAIQDADELIAKFGSDTKSTTQSARKGCFIIFGIILVPMIGLLGYTVYLYFRGRQ